jgi:hypothetical protein
MTKSCFHINYMFPQVNNPVPAVVTVAYHVFICSLGGLEN